MSEGLMPSIGRSCGWFGVLRYQEQKGLGLTVQCFERDMAESRPRYEVFWQFQPVGNFHLGRQPWLAEV